MAQNRACGRCAFATGGVRVLAASSYRLQSHQLPSLAVLSSVVQRREQMSDEWVTLPVDDGTQTRAFIARPSGSSPHPGLIVIMEALGVNEQIRGVARRYAEQGYVAIAPDMFHRAEKNFETSVFDPSRFMPL